MVAPTPVVAPIWDHTLVKSLPGDVHIGDSQLNLLIQNSGNQNLTNLNAIITGDGLSVYTQEPIKMLAPGDSKWILAWINTKKSGRIPLEVKVIDKEFRINLNVIDTEANIQAKKTQAEVVARRRKASEIQGEISNLSDVYEAFQRDYSVKDSKNYVLAGIDLSDAKRYLRTAQEGLAKDDLEEASANVVLLNTELNDIRGKLMAAQPKPRTWIDILRENLPYISALVGALVGGIAVYEKVKTKSQELKASGGLFGRNKRKEDEDDD